MTGNTTTAIERVQGMLFDERLAMADCQTLSGDRLKEWMRVQLRWQLYVKSYFPK
jgi:hypothetical protein